MARVVFTRSASKEWRALPGQAREWLRAAIEQLAEDWPRITTDVKPLVGRPRVWRIRVGRHRGVFEEQGDELVFTRFGHRSSVYR